MHKNTSTKNLWRKQNSEVLEETKKQYTKSVENFAFKSLPSVSDFFLFSAVFLNSWDSFKAALFCSSLTLSPSLLFWGTAGGSIFRNLSQNCKFFAFNWVSFNLNSCNFSLMAFGFSIRVFLIWFHISTHSFWANSRLRSGFALLKASKNFSNWVLSFFFDIAARLAVRQNPRTLRCS